MHRRTAHKLTISPLESLEDRIALTATAVNPLESLVDARSAPILGVIYAEYVNYYQAGSQGAFLSAQSAQVEMIGPTVGVDLQFSNGNFLGDAAQVQQMGLMVTAAVPSMGIVEGFMPIAGLPSLSLDQNVSSINAVFKPNNGLPTPNSSGPIAPTPTPTAPTPTPTPTTGEALLDGTALGSVYEEYVNYEQAGGQGTFSPAAAPYIVIDGTSVGIDLQTPLANFDSMLGEMQALGMQVTATAAVGQEAIIEGLMPIAQLPAVAANAGVVALNPVYRPAANSVG
jgi:hypothetical protein